MKRIILIVLFVTFSAKGVREGLVDPALIERYSFYLGWAEAGHVSMEMRHGSQLYSAAEVFEKAMPPFSSEPHRLSDQKLALLQTRVLGWKAFQAGYRAYEEDHDWTPKDSDFEEIYQIPKRCSFFNVPVGPLYTVLASLKAQMWNVNESVFWFYQHGVYDLAQGQIGIKNKQAWPKVIEHFQHRSSAFFSQENLAFLIPFCRNVLNVYARYWDIRLNGYTLSEEQKRRMVSLHKKKLRIEKKSQIRFQLGMYTSMGAGKWDQLLAVDQERVLGYFKDIADYDEECWEKIERLNRRHSLTLRGKEISLSSFRLPDTQEDRDFFKHFMSMEAPAPNFLKTVEFLGKLEDIETEEIIFGVNVLHAASGSCIPMYQAVEGATVDKESQRIIRKFLWDFEGKI